MHFPCSIKNCLFTTETVTCLMSGLLACTCVGPLLGQKCPGDLQFGLGEIGTYRVTVESGLCLQYSMAIFLEGGGGRG